MCTQSTIFKGSYIRKKEPVKQPKSYWDTHEYIKTINSLDRHIELI